MQVSCPSCSTAYEIPPPVRPRRLRCARCETEWRELPPGMAEPAPGPEAASVPDAPPPPAAEPEEAAGEPIAAPATLAPPRPADAIGAVSNAGGRRSGGLVWLLLWLLSLALVAVLVFAAWHFRVPIEHARPETLRLFRLIPGGVPPAA